MHSPDLTRILVYIIAISYSWLVYLVYSYYNSVKERAGQCIDVDMIPFSPYYVDPGHVHLLGLCVCHVLHTYSQFPARLVMGLLWNEGGGVDGTVPNSM